MFFFLFIIAVYSQSSQIIHEGTIMTSERVEVQLDVSSTGVSECSELNTTQTYYWKAIQFNSVKEEKLLLQIDSEDVKLYLKSSEDKKCNLIESLDKSIQINTRHQYRLIVVSEKQITETINVDFFYEYQNNDPIPEITQIPFYKYIIVPEGIPKQINKCDKKENDYYGYSYTLKLQQTTKVRIHTCNISESQTVLTVLKKDSNECIQTANAIDQKDNTCANGNGCGFVMTCEANIAYTIQVGLEKAPVNETDVILSIEYVNEEEKNESSNNKIDNNSNNNESETKTNDESSEVVEEGLSITIIAVLVVIAVVAFIGIGTLAFIVIRREYLKLTTSPDHEQLIKKQPSEKTNEKATLIPDEEKEGNF